MKRFYADFAKVEEQSDGTLKVYGIASSEAVDSDGEIIKADAIRDALPDYMKFGAVREMHQPIAAGTAVEASVQDDGKTWFGAHIVDPVAVKKVQAKVYKGFSIGGKVVKRDELNKNTITQIKLVEVSLVDRPANPDAVFEIVKLDDGGIEEAPVEKTDKQLDAEATDEIMSLVKSGKITVRALAKNAREAVTPRAKIIPDNFKKGMYSLQDFVSTLAQIQWLAQSSADEAQWEGDNSPLPAQLKDWLAQGVMIFENMVAEETSEMLASLKAALPQITKAEEPAIEKAGAKFSKETRDALAGIHKAMKECCDKMGGLGYDQDGDGATQADEQKVESSQQIEKADSLGELLKSELEKSNKQIEQLASTVDDLQKKLKAIADQPAPAKGVLLAVNKADDVTIGDANQIEIDPVKKSDGSVDEAATLIKSAHRTGGQRLVF